MGPRGQKFTSEQRQEVSKCRWRVQENRCWCQGDTMHYYQRDDDDSLFGWDIKPPRRRTTLTNRLHAGLVKVVLLGFAVVTVGVVLISMVAGVETSTASVQLHGKSIKLSELSLSGPMPVFKDVAMVGHLAPDLDSVAGAISAAFLFNGTPTIPGEINPEARHALTQFQLPVPIFANDSSLINKTWLLVDHGSKSQNFLDDESVVGLIDHHSMAEDEVDISHPIYVDIRPWGSVNTILSFMYSRYQVAVPHSIAGLMLAAITSDTLNLRSPTTTVYDRIAHKQLGQMIGISSQKELDDFALDLFLAKSNTTGMTPAEIVTLDYKEYVVGSVRLGWGSGETAAPQDYLNRTKEFMVKFAR